LRDLLAALVPVNDVVAHRKGAVVVAKVTERAAQVKVTVGDVGAGEVASESGLAGARGSLEQEAEVGFFFVGFDFLHVIKGSVAT
jgi:hypothetical protein